MGLKANLTLLVLVGGMGAYLYIKGPQTEKPDPGPGPENLGQPLFAEGEFLGRAAQIKFIPKTNQPILLERDQNTNAPRFFVQDPVVDLASSAVIQGMIQVYQGAILQQGYSEVELQKHPELMAETGLAEPEATVEVRWAGGKTKRIELGKAGMDEAEIFVRVDGGPVMLGSRALINPVRVNPDDLRERVMFDSGSIGLHPQRVRLQTDLPQMKRVDELTRTPAGAYRITEPGRFRADPRGVRGFLGALSSMRIDRFITGALSPAFQALIDTPQVKLEVWGARGRETLVASQLDAQAGWLGHLQQRKVTFMISNERSMVSLLGWVQNLRARALIPFPLDEVTRIEVDPRQDRVPLVFKRKHDGFDLEMPVQTDTNPTPMQELLTGLQDLQAQEFLDSEPADSGLRDGDPYLALRIIKPSGGARIHMRIGARKGELVHVRREDETTVVLVAYKAVAPLFRDWPLYVSRRVMEFGQRVFRMEARVPGKAEPLVYLRTPELNWHQEGGTEVDDLVASLVEDLALLKARGDDPIRPVAAVEGRDVERVLLHFMRSVTDRGDPVLVLELWPDGDKHVLLRSNAQQSQQVIYRLRRPLYLRQLYERWTR